MTTTELPIEGVWERAPGDIVHMATAEHTLVLAEVPKEGAPMRVHVRALSPSHDLRGRADSPWQSWLVPAPPHGGLCEGSGAWLDVEEDAGACNIACTRIEYQGGSHGVALATLRDGQWMDVGEIESPTDCDISFGRPLVRRGNDVFTVESDEMLWHYTRESGAWRGRVIETPKQWKYLSPQAANADGTKLFVCVIDRERARQLARFDLHDGRFALAKSIALPGEFDLAQAPGIDGALYVGFRLPAADGSLVWTLSEELEVLSRTTFPAPTIAKSGHLIALSVSREWMLVAQLDDVWVRRIGTVDAPRRLAMPVRADGRARRPQAVVVGGVAVVCLAGEVGVFGLG